MLKQIMKEISYEKVMVFAKIDKTEDSRVETLIRSYMSKMHSLWIFRSEDEDSIKIGKLAITLQEKNEICEKLKDLRSCGYKVETLIEAA